MVFAVGLGTLVGCAQIVGIVDTDVKTQDAGDDASSGAAVGDSSLGNSDVADVTPIGMEASSEGSSGSPDPGNEGGKGPIDASTEAGADATTLEAGTTDAGPCVPSTARCVPSGREACVATQWTSSPCPTNTPTCGGSGQCSVRGPTMVKVGNFYVDSTEVTVAQYQAFVTAKDTDTSGQPGVCSWNASYTTSRAPDPDTWPMSYVDWCDAYAYCAWAGKHLCGKIGGGPVAPASALDASQSQWFLACGGPNGNSHPNSTSVCNSSGGNDDVAPVGSFAGCEGFYTGLFDLEGNVAEWVDSCDSTDAGAADNCHLLGGSYLDNQSYCTEQYASPRNDTAHSFGFRCCGG